MKFATTLLLACATVAQAAEKPLAALVGDRAPASIQRTMTSPTPKTQLSPSLTYVADYEVIGATVSLSEAQSARLAALLKNPASFTTAGQKFCGFRPGVAYRCGTGSKAIDLLVCFSCDEIAVVPLNGSIVASYSVPQPARDVLLGLAKELLPNDEAIQALPKIRSAHPVPPPAVPVPKDAPRQGQSSGPDGA
jgi:hypothetical protein